MAQTWSSVVENGISSEERSQLVSKYPPPENAALLRVPVLNDTIKKATNESVVQRDARLAGLQEQISASISGIGLVISLMLGEEGGGNMAYLRPLCDAGRLLADVFHSETRSRKELAVYNLDKGLKETLLTAAPGHYLFGDDLDKRIEASKQLERSVRTIKPVKTIPAKKLTYKQLNYKSLPRPTQRGYQGRQQYQNRTPFYQQRAGRRNQERRGRRPAVPPRSGRDQN